MKRLLFIVIVILLTACNNTIYVVRHAEKEAQGANMSADVPLSTAGTERAEALRDLLKDKKISAIFSTKFLRTRGTALPLSQSINIPILDYDARDTLFVTKVKEMKKNILIVGHSNTVDNIINSLTHKPLIQDLPETQYGDLFILRKKMGGYTLEKSRYGK